MTEKSFSATFWAVIAVGAVAIGFGVAILGGYFLGHFTGHTKTTTVAASGASPASASETSAVASEEPGATGGQAAEGAEALVAGKTSALSTSPPKLTDIGAGLEGVQGLKASIFSEGLPNVESLTTGPEPGEYFASTGAEEGPNGVYLLKEGAKPLQLISGLPPTVGVLWHDNQLYVSSYGSVVAYSDFEGAKFASHRTVLSNLPVGKLGSNGDIKAGPEGRIYLAIGSPCDGCQPPSALSASIISFNPDGSDVRFLATNLRGNAFFQFAPNTGAIFAVSNERDDLEPTIPDELILVQKGDDFGYPRCRHDFAKELSCQGVTQPLATLDEHGAQDGIAFVEGEWGAAKSGLSAITTEWIQGKVLQSEIIQEGETVTAKPQQIIGGLKNPASVLATGEPGQLLIADYGTGNVYTVEPGEPEAEEMEMEMGGEEPAAEAEPEAGEAEAGAEPGGEEAAAKPSSTLVVEANPAGSLMFTMSKLTAKAGNVELEFVNKSSVPHNVAVEKEGKVIGETEIIAKGTDSTVLKLEPGTYTYFCTVPGHREAGMEGTLLVK